LNPYYNDEQKGFGFVWAYGCAIITRSKLNGKPYVTICTSEHTFKSLSFKDLNGFNIQTQTASAIVLSAYFTTSKIIDKKNVTFNRFSHTSLISLLK
jgi:hypothetical protein